MEAGGGGVYLEPAVSKIKGPIPDTFPSERIQYQLKKSRFTRDLAVIGGFGPPR
jgi:hypothetical protein